jgi:DNA-binding CsgD family transcriptional regulator
MNVSSFFAPLDLNRPPTAKEYGNAALFVQAADAFARATNSCVYIIDYYRQGFLYVSDNPLFLCGKTAKAVQQLGYLFYVSQVPPQDLELLLEINEAGFRFYGQLPIAERMEYSISYDFHLLQANKKPVLINHHLTPLALDEAANIWLALCVVTHSSNQAAGNIVITKRGSSQVFEYDRASKSWQGKPQAKLTGKEKEILTLTMKGFTIKELSARLGVSIATVKFHRKNIQQKFRVRNMPEAVSYAVNHGLL